MSDEQTGGALEGTLTGGLGSSDPGQNAMGASRQFSLDLQNSFKDAQNAGKINFTMEKKGGEEPMVKAEMPAAVMTKIQDILKNYEHIEASYAQEIAENKNREDQVRRNPLMNVLTQVSAQLAQGKRNPDWVQALGRASQNLNPTADQLRQQRMGMEQGLLGVLSGEKGLMQEEIAAEREKRLSASTAAKTELEQSKLDAKEKASSQRLLSDRKHEMAQAALGGKYVAGMGATVLKAYGEDPELADMTDAMLTAQSEQAKKLEEAKLEARSDVERMKVAAQQRRLESTFAQQMKVLDKRHEFDKAHGANKVLGEGAVKWENAKGERPDATETIESAVEKGFKPAGKMSVSDSRRSAMTLLDQLYGLLPSMEDKGFLSTGSNVLATSFAGMKRGVEPGDPDLAAWLAHAGTMVAIQRQLGDIGPRAITAYESAIKIISKPTSAAGAKQALDNLRDALLAGKVPQGDSDPSASSPPASKGDVIKTKWGDVVVTP
jgi:hypothetical protein